MKNSAFFLIAALLWSAAAVAQFVGPSETEGNITVAEARRRAVDTYVTVTGHLVAHLGDDYYTFRDHTGDIRVEIEPRVWRNQRVGTEATVRLVAEVDRDAAVGIYLWVESLQKVD